MKKTILVILSFFYSWIELQAQVAVNTTGATADTHAILDVSSSTKGMLTPRMTQLERDAIVSPPSGLLIYNTSAVSFQYFNGASWINITHSGLITGTANKIPRFTGPWGLQNGLFTDDGNGVSLNTTNAVSNASALLDISSSDKGVLIPRMTSASRIGISNPAKGLLVFDSTSNSFWYQGGAGWTEMSSSSNTWASNGSDIYNSNTGNVGINTAVPLMKMHITDNTEQILLIENSTPSVNGSVSEGIFFGNDISNPSNPHKYQAAIKNIQPLYSDSRIGFFTTVSGNLGGMAERLTISGGGNVGINDINPGVTLSVGGNIQAYGMTLLNDCNVLGQLTVGSNLSVGTKGAVISNTAAMQKIQRLQITLGVVNFPAYSYIFSGAFSFDTFSDIPTVTVGGVNNGNGGWYQVNVVPVAITNNSCVFMLYNTGPTPVTFSNVTWQALVVGNK